MSINERLIINNHSRRILNRQHLLLRQSRLNIRHLLLLSHRCIRPPVQLRREVSQLVRVRLEVVTPSRRQINPNPSQFTTRPVTLLQTIQPQHSIKLNPLRRLPLLTTHLIKLTSQHQIPIKPQPPVRYRKLRLSRYNPNRNLQFRAVPKLIWRFGKQLLIRPNKRVIPPRKQR